MTKQKSSAQIHVANGVGGMRPVTDLRFEAGQWPIEFIIPARDAKTWMEHLDAEIEERGWSSSTLSQLDAAENSGTILVHTATGSSPPSIEIVWEKLRGGNLQLRAKPSGDPILSIGAAHDFVNTIGERQRARKTLVAHRRELLTYDGLPWRGELWLDAHHRLGPPSKYPDTLLGPQIIIVDAMIEGIGQRGVTSQFQRRLHEICVFLSFVLGLNVRANKIESGWVCDINEQLSIADCAIRYVGYAEISQTPEFPPVGDAAPIARREVTRPGLGPLGIWPDMQEEWVPADIEQLWDLFIRLPSPTHEQLLRAGNAYKIAKAMWPDQRTAYAAFLVVACEALKPIGKRYDRMNVYDVVGSLVGASEAQGLRQLSLHPQKVRSEHLHRGKLLAGELLPMLVHDYFMDPSFSKMLRHLSAICRICLIEWLRCGGNYKVIRLAPDKHGIKSGIIRLLRRWRIPGTPC